GHHVQRTQIMPRRSAEFGALCRARRTPWVGRKHGQGECPSPAPALSRIAPRRSRPYREQPGRGRGGIALSLSRPFKLVTFHQADPRRQAATRLPARGLAAGAPFILKPLMATKRHERK